MEDLSVSCCPAFDLRRIVLLARSVPLLAMLLAAGCGDATVGEGDGRDAEPGVVVDNGDETFELTGLWKLRQLIKMSDFSLNSLRSEIWKNAFARRMLL